MFNNSWAKTLLFLLLVSIASADHDESTFSIGYNNKVYFATSSNNIWTINEYDGTNINTIKTFDTGVSIQSIWKNNKGILGVVSGGKLYIWTYSYSSGSSSYTFWSYDGSTFESAFSHTPSLSNGYTYIQEPFDYNSKLHFSMGTTSYSSNANFDRGYRLYSLTGSDTTKVATISTASSDYNPYNSNYM